MNTQSRAFVPGDIVATRSGIQYRVLPTVGEREGQVFARATTPTRGSGYKWLAATNLTMVEAAERPATPETVQEDTMTEPTTPAQDVSRLSPAAYNMQAARRWINECYEGAANCADWTTLQVLEFIAEQHVDGLPAFRRFKFYPTYQQASPEAQAAVDVVFGAVEDVALPYMGVSLDYRDGAVGASFSLPTTDPDQPIHYRVEIDPAGRLDVLRKLVSTGRWSDNGDGELEPDVHWVTITRFSQDLAGKLFKRSRAAAYASQTGAWMDAVTR